MLDKTNIKDIKFKFPELMSDNAKETLMSEYKEYLSKIDRLDALRKEETVLEKEISKMKSKLFSLSSLVTFEYEEIQTQDKYTECNLGVVNHSDARYK